MEQLKTLQAIRRTLVAARRGELAESRDGKRSNYGSESLGGARRGMNRGRIKN
jgi:hypothetical protein